MLVLLTLWSASALWGQSSEMLGSNAYEREVFHYLVEGRRDPFRSLLYANELGMPFEDLELRGVLYHPDPDRSVAVITVRGSEQRFQTRIGDRVGTLHILAILPDRVEVAVEELGAVRRESMRLRVPDARGSHP